MSKSRRLRLGDVRRALRVVGECRDLGADPRAWLAHAMTGVARLVDAKVAVAALQPPGGFAGAGGVAVQAAGGWEVAPFQAAYDRLMRSGDYRAAPDYRTYVGLARPAPTVRRRRLAADPDWYRSAHFAEYVEPAGVDDYVLSNADGAAGTASTTFRVNRAAGRPGFTAREGRVVHLFHQELARLVGVALADGRADPLAGLPPRLRAVLGCLLDGDSEKQAAARLGLSRHTVHDYVKELHRRLGASSRGELLARCGGPGRVVQREEPAPEGTARR